MPAPESEITDNELTIEDFRHRLESGGFIEELSELEAIIAAARAAGMEEASLAIQSLIQARNEEELNDYQNGFMDALDCAWHAIRSRIKDQ